MSMQMFVLTVYVIFIDYIIHMKREVQCQPLIVIRFNVHIVYCNQKAPFEELKNVSHMCYLSFVLFIDHINHIMIWAV